MIIALLRGRRSRRITLLMVAVVVGDLLLGPLLIRYVTLPLIAVMAQRYPQLSGLADMLTGFAPAGEPMDILGIVAIVVGAIIVIGLIGVSQRASARREARNQPGNTLGPRAPRGRTDKRP
jgi:hypothetical protein